MNKLHIDFETRSTLDLKKVGAYKYAKHPSTEILCMSYAYDNEPVQVFKYSEKVSDGFMLFLIAVQNGTTKLCAFNAYFERCIFRFTVPRMQLMDSRFNHIWKPEHWQCTMAKACVCGLTGTLDVVCTLLGMKDHKDQAGKRVMMKMCKPRRPRKAELETIKHNQILWHETPEDFEALYKYCKQDVEVERGIDRRLPRISVPEQALWQVDQRINDTGIAVDMPRVTKAIALMGEQKKRANTKIKYLTEFRVGAITQIAKIKKELERYEVYADSLDASHLEELIESDIPDRAKEILLLRKNNGKSSTAKYEAIKEREVDGSIHGLFRFHLATTGRWGSGGVQLHNLPRGNIKDIDTARFAFDTESFWMYEPMSNLLSCLIRSMLIAKDDHNLYAADYTAIEAKALNWLAKQWDFVKMYDEGVDTYVHMAKIIFNTEDIDTNKRWVGKQTELGAGYGMGADRFCAQCASYPAEYRQDVPIELAEKAVKAYRKSHPKVVKFWYGTEAIVKNAINNKGQVYHYNGIYAKVSKSFLKIKLLSGRLLYYFRPQIDDDKNIRFWGYDSQRHQVCKQYTYGAKLVENIVQATARDILAHALMALEGTKYQIILHVHDEIVSQVSEHDQADIDEYCEIVSSLPDWAKGCPTKAEGWVGKYYKKD